MKKKHLSLLIAFVVLIITSCSNNEELTEEKKAVGLNSVNYNSDGSIYSENTYKYYYNSDDYINKIHIKRVYKNSPEKNHEYIVNFVFDGEKLISEEFDYILKRENRSNIIKIEYEYSNDLITYKTSFFDNDTQETVGYEYNSNKYLIKEDSKSLNLTLSNQFFYNNKNLLEKIINFNNDETLFNYRNILNPFYKASPFSLRRKSNIQKEIAFPTYFEIEVIKDKVGYPLNLKRYRDGNLWSEVSYIYQ